MILYYLDASAWIKRYCQEDGSAWIADFFADGPAIACSALGFIEVLCTFGRKKKAGEMTARQCREKGREAERDFNLFYRTFLTAEILETARVLPARCALRGSDTVHLASALYVRKSGVIQAEEVKFVASDDELATEAEKNGFHVLKPSDIRPRGHQPSK